MLYLRITVDFEAASIKWWEQQSTVSIRLYWVAFASAIGRRQKWWKMSCWTHLERDPIRVLDPAVVLGVLFHCSSELRRHETFYRMSHWNHTFLEFLTGKVLRTLLRFPDRNVEDVIDTLRNVLHWYYIVRNLAHRKRQIDVTRNGEYLLSFLKFPVLRSCDCPCLPPMLGETRRNCHIRETMMTFDVWPAPNNFQE